MMPSVLFVKNKPFSPPRFAEESFNPENRQKNQQGHHHLQQPGGSLSGNAFRSAICT
jgi:hypothetical protein